MALDPSPRFLDEQRLAERRLTPEITAPGLISGFRRADGGAPARWATSVRLDWDERELRLRFECEDEDAWSTFRERDAALWQEEVVELFIAPGPEDPTEYFEFEVSPLGMLFDAKISNPTGRRPELRADTSWDCPGLRWGAGRGTERQDWWAELAIPWVSLVPEGPLPEVFRLNFFRVERPRGGEAEFSAWSPTFTEPPDFHQPRCFGRLHRSAMMKAIHTTERTTGTMFESLAGALVTALALYTALGLAFGVAFVARGAGRLDASALHGSWGFRLMIFPASAALWPLLAWRWWRKARG